MTGISLKTETVDWMGKGDWAASSPSSLRSHVLHGCNSARSPKQECSDLRAGSCTSKPNFMHGGLPVISTGREDSCFSWPCFHLMENACSSEQFLCLAVFWLDILLFLELLVEKPVFQIHSSLSWYKKQCVQVQVKVLQEARSSCSLWLYFIGGLKT